jgi:hypothetical protein
MSRVSERIAQYTANGAEVILQTRNGTIAHRSADPTIGAKQ